MGLRFLAPATCLSLMPVPRRIAFTVCSFLQVPSTETAPASDSGTSSSSALPGCSESSTDNQQGRGRISQAEAGLTLEGSSAPAEAVQFQAEVISSIDKVRLWRSVLGAHLFCVSREPASLSYGSPQRQLSCLWYCTSRVLIGKQTA